MMKFLGRSVHVIPHELVQKYVEFHISYTDFVDLRRTDKTNEIYGNLVL
jgi:hypothetical protein